MQEKVERYALKFWLDSGMEQWPEVRQVCRRFRISRLKLQDIIDGSNKVLDTEFYNAYHVFGDRFVTVENEAVEAAWRKYYATI